MADDETNASRSGIGDLDELLGLGGPAPDPDAADWGPWLGIDPVTGQRVPFVSPVWYKAGDAERAVAFQPGFRTSRNSYGKHGMEVTWLLRGPRGVTMFVMNTGWVPGEEGVPARIAHLFPLGVTLGYHAPHPQYESQQAIHEGCDYLGGASPCYADGSGGDAQALVRRFVIEGEAVIWRVLEQRHAGLLVPQR